jgi:hypothetical protein
MHNLLHGQSLEEDSLKFPRHLIKYNLSTPLLFGFDNVILSYEHIHQPHRSWSVNLGFRNLPNLVNPDSVFFIKQYRKKGGISLMVDYRFYLKKENRYAAPRGIFISPFVIGFADKFSTDLSILKDGNVITDEFQVNTELITIGAGVKLGYQFVFGDHWTLDFDLLGPSLAYYRLNMELEGQLEIDEEYRKYLEVLKDVIQNIFPGAKQLLDNGSLSADGSLSMVSAGFQYCIRVGYLF